MDDQDVKPWKRFRPGFWRRYALILGAFVLSQAVLVLASREIDSDSGDLVVVLVRLVTTIVFVVVFLRFVRRERAAYERDRP